MVAFPGISGKVYEISLTELTDEELDERFGRLVTEANSAFAIDPRYIIEMAESAALLIYKKDLWKARMEVQRANEAATKACSLRPAKYVCPTTSPCGFGTCRFATPFHATIKTDAGDGPQSVRPIPATQPTYALDGATKVLLTIRGVFVPSKSKG